MSWMDGCFGLASAAGLTGYNNNQTHASQAASSVHCLRNDTIRTCSRLISVCSQCLLSRSAAARVWCNPFSSSDSPQHPQTASHLSSADRGCCSSLSTRRCLCHSCVCSSAPSAQTSVQLTGRQAPSSPPHHGDISPGKPPLRAG